MVPRISKAFCYAAAGLQSPRTTAAIKDGRLLACRVRCCSNARDLVSACAGACRDVAAACHESAASRAARRAGVFT